MHMRIICLSINLYFRARGMTSAVVEGIMLLPGTSAPAANQEAFMHLLKWAAH
jgi:hypothetical protein